MKLKTIGVVGAGTMGNGIAQTCAVRGYDVIMQDVSDEVVQKGLGSIQNSLGRLLGKEKISQADHDDVAQEVFLKIFLKIEQYRGPQPFEHWVSRIAVTTCYDWLRKHRIRPLVTYSDLSEAEVEILEKSRQATSRGTSDAQRELFSGLLDKLISTLNPREQIVIRLLDLEERSVRDISELTGWGSSKIKVTAMRARRKLANRLHQLESSQEQGKNHH